MKNNQNPLHAQVVPMQGQKLPGDWQQKASARAALAQADYEYRLQNAWKRGSQGADPNLMRAARLSSDSNALSPEELVIRSRLSSKGTPVDWSELLGEK